MQVRALPGGRYAEIVAESPHTDLPLLDSFLGGHKHRSRPSRLVRRDNPLVLKSVLRRLKRHVKNKVRIHLDAEIAQDYLGEPKLKPLPAGFRYHTAPLEHQDIALRYLWTYPRFGLGLDPGLGKTKVVLDWFALLQVKKALVICPKPLFYEWLRQAPLHRPDLKVHVLSSVSYRDLIATRTEKLQSPDLDRDTRRRLEAELRTLERERQEENDRVRDAQVIVANYAKLLQNETFFTKMPWDAVAIDEALVKNPDSEQSRVIQAISDKGMPITLMSGTLINNDAGDCFSPIRILDRSVLGSSFYAFKQRYAVYRQFEDPEGKTRNLLVGYKDVEEIQDALNSVFLFMRKEQWLKDLPPKIFKEIEVELSEDQKRVYKLLKENYAARLLNDEWVEADNPMVLAGKLAQISSGFIYYGSPEDELRDLGLVSLATLLQGKKGKDGAKSKRVKKPRFTFKFAENPKIDAAMALLTGELAKKKVVLWYNFGAEEEMLAAALRQRGITYRTINGETKDSGKLIAEFNTTENVQVLMCQAKAVNYGITLLGRNIDDCEYEPELSPEVYTHVFYSLNYSLEVFLQQQDRSHRIGMTHSPTYYILRGKTMIERTIYRRLLARMEVREAFVRDTLRPPPSKEPVIAGLGDD